MKKLFAFLFGVTLVGQAWAQTTTILRQDDNQTAACYFSSNYFQFDFNNGASFEISYDGVIISSTECSPVEEYSATFGACVRNFVKNGATIEFDLLDGEYSTTQFAHYITRFPVAVSAFAENGIVSIEGSNAVGQTITLTVTPNDDYEFNCWSDGNTDNPRTINITSNMDLKAVCLTEGQTLVNLTVTAGENGTVSGGGVYGSGIAASLRATPNTGYHFVRWSDGNTDNPRTVAVSEDATFTAEFEEHTVVIDDAAEPPTTLPGYGYSEGSHCSVCGVTINQGNYTYWKQITTSAENGSVSGAGIYYYGQTVTLTATPNEGCSFNCWSDGNTENPRTVSIDWGSENSDYKAICLTEGQTIANLTVSAGNNGTATGGGAFISGTETTFTLQATPNTGYHFVRWSDGNTSNPRTVAVTENATFTAEFEEHTIVIDAAEPPTTLPGYGYTEGSHCSVCGVTINQQNYTSDWKQITTSAENGSVSGAGICHYGQTVTLTATPNEGCTFSCWSDGNTDNPRTVSIDWVDYKAICLTEGQTIANLTVSAGNNGTATGGGAFISGTETTFTLQAKPNTGYHFVRWSDGNTDNPRTLTVSTDKTLTAEFEAHNAVIDAAVPAGTRPGLTQGSHCSVCNMVMEPQEIIYIIGVYSFEIHGEDYHPEVNHGNDDRFIEPDSPVFAINTYETDVNGWDSQFFIVFANENDALRADNTISLKFEYKRTGRAALSLIQIHSTPHHDANTFFGVSAGTTEEWQTYEESFEINSSYYSDGYRTIAIDASTGENGTLLLRNIVVKVNGNEVFNTISPTEEFAIVAATNSDTYGSAEVIGKTTYNSEVSLKATPNTGYHFVSWNDGNTENPRTITVTGNAAYTANFEIDNYNVSATADATTGNAFCSASKADYGSNVTFYAIPKYGYFFKNWSNGSTAAMQNVTISGNTTLTAIFEQYPPVIVKDTVIRDTIKVEVEVPVPIEVVKDTVIHDTLKVDVLKTDTLYLQEKIIRDTVFATKTDTLIYYKDVKIVHDTVKIEIAVHDTVLNTVLDTVFNTIHDIVENKIFIHDTIYITKTDTIYLQTSVSDSKAIGLSIYPNPTASFVTVTGEGVFGYVLTNANGKVLRKEEDAASYIVDLSEYADGIYLLHTSDGITHKIVKQ